MKTLKIILKFLIIDLILAILIAGIRFLIYTLITLGKVFWIALKLTIKFTIISIYYFSRLLAWPFKNCFPPKNLDQLSGLEFEQFCSNWLALEGYRSIIKTPNSSDYGVDILTIKDQERIGIQCKRYSGKVGVGAIQEITAGIQYYECNKGIVITNSKFTKNAIELAEANNIELIDGNYLKDNRSCKTLTQNTFHMKVSVVIMFFFSLFSIWLTLFTLFKIKSMLPLAVMLLGICILTFINGCIEVKLRNNKDKEEDYIDETELSEPF